MIALKSCPRCHGDLHIAVDKEASCLQCGYELKPAEQERLLAKIEQVRKQRELIAA
jgi:hypothetical protein